MPVDLTISSCLPTANGALYICSGSQQTDPGDIVKIRDAIKENKEACLCLINYKKNGSAFNNQFYLVPLFSAGGQLAYFLGIQVEVETPDDGQQQPKNLGWIRTMCLAE